METRSPAESRGDDKALDELLRGLAAGAADLVGADRCSVFLTEGSGATMRGRVSWSRHGCRDEEIRRFRAGLPADRMTHEMVATRRPVVIENAQTDPRVVRSTVRYWSIRSIMAVPLLLDGRVTGMLLLDDAGRRRRFDPGQAEAALAFARLSATLVEQGRGSLALRDRVATANRELLALRRGVATGTRLAEAIGAGGSPRDLVETLTRALARPCALFRRGGEPLAVCAELGDGVRWAHLLDRRAGERSGASDEPRLVGPEPRHGLVHRLLVAPVLDVDETVWANLVAVERHGWFAAADRRTLKRAATLIGLTIPPAPPSRSREAEVRPATDPPPRPRPLLRLATAETAPAVAPGRAWALALVGTRAGDRRAVLLELPAGAEPTRLLAARRDLLEYAREPVATAASRLVAVSSVRHGPGGGEAALREAEQVLELVRRFASPGRRGTFLAEEIGGAALFLHGSDRDQILDAAERALAGLAEQPDTKLLATLRAYFASRASVAETAATLAVHENTVRHRMGRIEGLTGLRLLTDPDARIRIQVALTVLDLQGRLPAAGEKAAA